MMCLGTAHIDADKRYLKDLRSVPNECEVAASRLLKALLPHIFRASLEAATRWC